MFALFWMIYLMGATAVMFSGMSRAHAISTEITRPAARMMILLCVIGIAVFWPMVRLAQHHPPRSHVKFMLRDALVLFVPLQAAIWPQISPVLAHWPLAVVGGLSLHFAAWILLLAGVLSVAVGSVARAQESTMPRAIWMSVILLVVFAVPILAVIGTPVQTTDVDTPRVDWLLSPVAGIYEILRDRDQLGVSAKVFSQQIRMLIAIGCVGLALLLIARAIEVARERVAA